MSRPTKRGSIPPTNEAPIKAGFKPPKSPSLVVLPLATFVEDWIRWLFPRVEHAAATLLAMLALIFQDPKAPAVTASAIVVAAPTAFALALEPNESPPNQSHPEPAATAPPPPRARAVAAPARKARAAKPRPALRIRLGKTIAHEWRQVNKARKRAQSAFVRLGHKPRHTNY